MTDLFKFEPQQRVWIKPLDCAGRINRCIIDGGAQPFYTVDFYTDATPRQHEFYEDELKQGRPCDG